MKKDSTPLVTIITPTYNRSSLLSKTIDSILNQNYKNIEYIVIDDGSTDDTERIVRNFQKINREGKKLVYVKQKNMGETKAVNKGFSLARGEIIAVINSDDPLLPGCVSLIIEYLDQNPSILAVYPDWEMIDIHSKKIQSVHPADYNYLTSLKEHYCMPGPGTFFRKKAIELTGGRDSRFHYIADFAFWLKLGMYDELHHLPKTLATFRIHSGSQGVFKKGQNMASEHKALVDLLFSDPDLPKEAQVLKSAAYSSAYYVAAKESIGFSQQIKYYFYSFVTNPINFLGKIRYEGVKLKSRLYK